ncbi:MAG: hypothetical protein RL885_07740 [Planctomycetota bacterium]
MNLLLLATILLVPGWGQSSVSASLQSPSDTQKIRAGLLKHDSQTFGGYLPPKTRVVLTLDGSAPASVTESQLQGRLRKYFTSIKTLKLTHDTKASRPNFLVFEHEYEEGRRKRTGSYRVSFTSTGGQLRVTRIEHRR